MTAEDVKNVDARLIHVESRTWEGPFTTIGPAILLLGKGQAPAAFFASHRDPDADMAAERRMIPSHEGLLFVHSAGEWEFYLDDALPRDFVLIDARGPLQLLVQLWNVGRLPVNVVASAPIELDDISKDVLDRILDIEWKQEVLSELRKIRRGVQEFAGEPLLDGAPDRGGG